MTTSLNPPPERDLPIGRLAQRLQYLIAETSVREQNVVASKPQRSMRRLLATLAVLAIVITAIMFDVSPGDEPGSLPQLGGQRAASAAAIEVTTTDGFYEIVFVTLAEDASQVEADLQALGLDVTVDFVPVSPSLEGHLVASESPEGADEVWEFTEPADFSGPAALHVPTDLTGALRLEVGRPAEDGEPFVSSAISAQHPGEALHCTDVAGMTVAEATSVIAATGVRVEFFNADDATAYGTSVPADQQDWYIVGTTPTAGGIVQAWLMSIWPDDGRTAEYLAFLNEGCDN